MDTLEKKVLCQAELSDGFSEVVDAGESGESAVTGLRVKPDRRRSSTRLLSEADRLTLERWSHSRSASYRLVLRSRIVLMVRGGRSKASTAKALATTARTVKLWCHRFDEGGADALRRDAPGRGRRPGLSPETIAAIVSLTGNPPDGLRPTARDVARQVGTSPESVCRVWALNGLRPGARRMVAGVSAGWGAVGRDDSEASTAPPRVSHLRV